MKTYQVPVLMITKCSDPAEWYHDLVGRFVPHRGPSSGGDFLSNAPNGTPMIVHKSDAKATTAIVHLAQLEKWPYFEVANLARPVVANHCAEICNERGLCQSLTNCQDQHRIDAATKKPQPMASTGQSRTHSLIETLTSIAVGFVVSMLLQAALLPMYGHHITLAQNIQIAAIFTVASVARGYWVRRLFNHLQNRSAA